MSQKNILPLLFIAVAVVAVFAFIVASNRIPQQQDQQQNQTNFNNGKEVDTDGWLTYRNEEYGFEVRYPENWGIQYFPDVEGAKIIEGHEKEVFIEISRGSLFQKGMSLYDFSKTYGFQNIESFEKEPASAEWIISKNNIKGVKVVYWVTLISKDPSGPKFKERIKTNPFVFFDAMHPQERKVRVVLINGQVNFGNVDANVFDQIINSFRYIQMKQ